MATRVQTLETKCVQVITCNFSMHFGKYPHKTVILRMLKKNNNNKSHVEYFMMLNLKNNFRRTFTWSRSTVKFVTVFSDENYFVEKISYLIILYKYLHRYHYRYIIILYCHYYFPQRHPLNRPPTTRTLRPFNI